MSSTPLRSSDFPPEPDCNARSKLSSTGSRALIPSASAYSRNSCWSRAARLRAFSKSACIRASRSSKLSRSAFNFCSSLPSPGEATPAAADGESSDPSAAGSSRSTSTSCGPISDCPLLLAISCLLVFVQDSIEKPCDVGNRVHGVLIVNPRRANHRQRSHHFAAYARGGPDQHKVAHGGQRLIKSNHNPHRLLLGVEISAEQFHNALLLLQRSQHVL